MDIKLLRCFVAVADELHFGRAAQEQELLPSALGRNIRLLEEELGIRLFFRTTRNVMLTRSGHILLNEIRPLLVKFDETLDKVRYQSESADRVYRIGSIDSPASGLLPHVIHDFREMEPNLELVLVEEKTVKLLPKLLSGSLDLAFVRPPTVRKEGIHFEFITNEAAVVALHCDSELAIRTQLEVRDIADYPLIVPSPRSRPHSYNLTNNLFIRAGLIPKYVQQAEEKQTIINLVGAKVGIAIIPFWNSKTAVNNVVFIPLVDENGQPVTVLPLAAAWVEGTHDKYRDIIIDVVKKCLSSENYE